MKKYSLFLLIAGWIGLHTACENRIDLNLEGKAPLLVMNALINSDSLENVLYLNLTGPYRMEHVAHATVEVRVNGALTETPEVLPPTSEGDRQKRYLITSRFRPGDVVRIDARTGDGQHHAWAEVVVPIPATIVGVDTLSVQRKEEYGGSTNLMRYHIRIKDRPQEKNYYRIAIDKHTSMGTYSHHWSGDEILTQTAFDNTIITREDVVLTDGQPSSSDDDDLLSPVKNIYAVFDDARFADTEYTMTIYMSNQREFYYYDPIWYDIDTHVRLMSITATEYHYLKLLNVLDSDAFDEVINEPFAFPSNVQGGTGIIGISAETRFLIHQNLVSEK